MFGYKLFKKVEIENLKEEMVFCRKTIDSQDKEIAELNNKIKEYENIIESLRLNVKELEGAIDNFHQTYLTPEPMILKSEKIDEKPVKKVRRKSSKKNTKKEI